jgi:hypothetical protein
MVLHENRRRVAKNHRRTEIVRLIVEGVSDPQQFCLLIIERFVRVDAGMNEEKRAVSMKQRELEEKLQMLLEHSSRAAIRSESAITAVLEPPIAVMSAPGDEVEEHVLVVSLQDDGVDVRVVAKRDELLEDARSVRTAIDVVAEEDDLVSSAEVDRGKKLAQLVRATVDIAYRE